MGAGCVYSTAVTVSRVLMVWFFYSTAIAVRCKDGVVFGVEKLVLSKLYEEGSNKRIFNVDKHVGMVPLASSLLLSCFFILQATGGFLKQCCQIPRQIGWKIWQHCPSVQ